MNPLLSEINSLLDTARRVNIDGDRAPLYIRADMKFLEGQDKAAPMVFNIPVGEDFFATRVNLYLSSRLVSLSNPDTQSELTYRATDWTSVNELTYSMGFVASDGQYANKYATCLFKLEASDGRKFQNSPMSMLHAFSDREPQPIVQSYQNGDQTIFTRVPYAAYNGGLDFDVEERLPAGSAWTLTVTPTFSRDVTAMSTDRREFMVIGVLTGHKKVKLFGSMS